VSTAVFSFDLCTAFGKYGCLGVAKWITGGVVMVLLVACGAEGSGSDDISPSLPSAVPSVPGSTTIASAATTSNESELPGSGSAVLVIERRQMSTTERERLGRTEPPPLDCDDVGEAFWDYDGTVEPGTHGRTADDALLEVINEFNHDARTDPRTTLDFDYVPLTGWIELQDGESSTFVYTDGDWRFAIRISGEANLSNWRPSGALTCPPDFAPAAPVSEDAPNGGFIGENDEVIALGTAEHIVNGTVNDLTAIPDLYGRSSLTLEIASVHSQADVRWNIGEQQQVPGLLPGDEIQVAVDGAWSVSPGDEISVALSSVPFDVYDGYVRVVLGTDVWGDVPAIGVDVGGGLGPDAIRRFVAAAADLRGVDLDAASDRVPQIDLLTELVLAARSWIDEVNLAAAGTAEPPPQGILADVYAALAPG
jgi:hypothetical protein